MKYFYLFFLLFEASSGMAQGSFPNLPTSGRSGSDLVPAYHRLITQAEGDLNGDGSPDLVIVTQENRRLSQRVSEVSDASEIHMGPRLMGIYFFDPNTGHYHKQEQINEFILYRETVNMDEPLDGLTITRRGVLQIDFHIFYSAGSWTMSDHSYKFRYQNGRFELIGYDSSEAHRASGETTDYSINFSTRKMSITKGSFLEGSPPARTEWRGFDLSELPSLLELGKPFQWAFMGTYL